MIRLGKARRRGAIHPEHVKLWVERMKAVSEFDRDLRFPILSQRRSSTIVLYLTRRLQVRTAQHSNQPRASD